MKAQMSLLSLAIASGLALAAIPAEAAGNLKSAAISRANVLLGANGTGIIRGAKGDVFAARDAIVDADGTEHVRFERSYRGLPVIGGDFVMHSRNGQLRNVSQSLKSAARPNLVAQFGSDEAIVEAGARFGSKFFGAPTSRMVVYARGASPVLAHEVVFNGIKADQTPTEMHYFVDASSGRILDQWDTVHTAKPGPGGSGCTGATAAVGTGKSLTEGTVVLNTTKCGSTYQLVDMTRGGGATNNMSLKTAGLGSVFTGTTNVWGDFLVSNAQTVAADAHYGVATTWDYYKNMHGRTGIANDGVGALTRVHYGRNYQNAFWSDGCFCMTFGDGDNGATILPLVALDIAGHEMSHGVTSRTAEPDLQRRVRWPERRRPRTSSAPWSSTTPTTPATGPTTCRREAVQVAGDPLHVQADLGQLLAALLRPGDHPDLRGAWRLRHRQQLLLPACGRCGGAGRLRRRDLGQPDPVVAGLQRQHQPGRHRSHRRREDLVPRTDRVHDLGHQLRPGPRGDAECRGRFVRRWLHPAQRRGRGVERGQGQLTARRDIA
jgi:hypothetical protein